MNKKADIEKILKQRFFVTPTSYPPQNGFLDYGPVLCQIKQEIISQFRKVFVDETVYEIEPSAVLPYEVLKNSGHVDKFCDIVFSDSTNIYRADHYIEEKIGDVIYLPNLKEISNRQMLMDHISQEKLVVLARRNSIKDSSANVSQLSEEEVKSILKNFVCIKKHVSDFSTDDFDLVVGLYNLHSPTGQVLSPARHFNLIFKLNERQFLRPELAQSQFTNFRKLFEMNNERLPFSSLCIGRSYRNEISARGGMLRTKEFEQAEIEFYTEDGHHYGFDGIRNVEVLILPNTCLESYLITLGEAYDTKVISSQAICYFIAKAQEFCLNIGIRLDSLRYRQHHNNEMAHYANDCWDVEIKTLSGWVECAGIADRSNYDLTVHANNVHTRVKKVIPPKIVYEIVLDKVKLGKKLKEKFKDLTAYAENLSQDYIIKNKNENKLCIEFENETYECNLLHRTTDCEFFIPQVIEPSFGISRILYSLVEQSFQILPDRNILSLLPKMCYLHCMIGFLKYLPEFDELVSNLRLKLRYEGIRFQISERNCSIGKKYKTCDEIGIPFFITFDFETIKDGTVTIRERDTTSQLRIKIDEVPELIKNLIFETTCWNTASKKYYTFN